MRRVLHAALCIGLAGWLFGCIDFGTIPWDPDGPDAGAHPASPSGGGSAPSASTPGGGSSTDPGSAGGTPDGDDAPAVVCPHEDGAQEVTVELVSNSFKPPEVTVCAGDTVTWKNLDSKEHTVFSGNPGAPDGLFSTDKLYFGETTSYTFTEPGEYYYYCSTHKKKMKGAKVVVL